MTWSKIGMGAAVGLILAGTTAAEAQETRKASLEVLQTCQGLEDSAAKVADCIPYMDAAMVALEAFDEVYSDAAAPLKDTCMKLNDGGRLGAWDCVKNEIEGAVSIAGMLADGQGLDDPMLEAVKDKEAFERIENIRQDILNSYPGRETWYSSSYFPYRKPEAPKDNVAPAEGNDGDPNDNTGMSREEACGAQKGNAIVLMDTMTDGGRFIALMAIALSGNFEEYLPDYEPADEKTYKEMFPSELNVKLDHAGDGLGFLAVFEDMTAEEKDEFKRIGKLNIEENYQRCLAAAE